MRHSLRRRATLLSLTALLLAALACGLPADRPRPTPTATEALGPVMPVDTSTPPSRATRAPASLATVRAQLTADPCPAAELAEYADTILAMANEHLAQAGLARGLDEQPDDLDWLYDQAVARLRQAQQMVPPACADKAHLKFTSAFRLLVDVWDHVGESEFDLARRKLASAFDETALAADELAQLQRDSSDASRY